MVAEREDSWILTKTDNPFDALLSATTIEDLIVTADSELGLLLRF